MNLTPAEVTFLTALAREHNQAGCRGPAHGRLRQEVYPDTPRTGPGSLAFAYDVVPLTNLVLRGCRDLEEIDDFLRRQPRVESPVWPWDSAEAFRGRLREARCYSNSQREPPAAPPGRETLGDVPAPAPSSR